MDQFVSQLGIDWRLLLSQAVNFLIVLVVLRLFVYKPVLATLHARRTKIEEGVTMADEAKRRLGEAENIKKEKMAEAEEEVMQMFKTSDVRLKQTEAERMAEMEKKAAQVMVNAEMMAKQKQAEFDEALAGNARDLLRMALTKVAAMEPAKIDEALLERATREALKHS